MEHLLFAAYLILFAWLITKVRFFTQSGLSNSQLVILFLLKVMAGIFYGWVGISYEDLPTMIDTWGYHFESLQEYELLKSDPWEFFTNLFRNTYEGGYTNFLSTENSWWNDVKANLLVKIMAIFNLFSFGQYYTNVIYYSFITMFGPVAIYRVMKDQFPGRNIPILVASFLIPSFLYWTSGLHKEGLIYLGLALMIYHFYFGFREKRFSISRILIILFGFAFVLILRNFVIITLLPPLLAWVLSSRLSIKPIYIFLVIGFISVALFFGSKYIHPKFDLPHATSVKQAEFLKLSGGSTIPVKKLEPTVTGFLKNTPQALSISIIRPYPSDVRHLLSLAASLEINLILLMFLVFLFWRLKVEKNTGFILFCLFFSLAVLLMIGFTVNNLGAIVRYRSIILPFLVIPMAALVDWKKIKARVFSNIKN